MVMVMVLVIATIVLMIIISFTRYSVVYSGFRDSHPGLFKTRERLRSDVLERFRVTFTANANVNLYHVPKFSFNLCFTVHYLSRRSSARNVSSGEERGETDVFAGYHYLYPKN